MWRFMIVVMELTHSRCQTTVFCAQMTDHFTEDYKVGCDQRRWGDDRGAHPTQRIVFQ